MKKQKLYLSSIYIFIILVMGSLLLYPLVAHEATEDSTSTAFMPPITDTDIQCKTVNISNTTTITLPWNGLDVSGNSCPSGYVPIGFNSGEINYFNVNLTSHNWISDISGWGVVTIYSWNPFRYYGRDAINQVRMICGQRQIRFTPGPCLQ